MARRIPLLLILICSVTSVAGPVSDGDTATTTPTPETSVPAVEPNPSQTAAGPEFAAPSPTVKLGASDSLSTQTLSAAQSERGVAPHVVTGIRVRPRADSLRLVLLLDSPPPYALRLAPGQTRAYLDLVNTRLEYLPSDLNRLDNAWLSGVWVKRLHEGVTVLELRLTSPQVHIEHFVLDEPAAIVLDIYRDDIGALPIPGPNSTVAHRVDRQPADPGPRAHPDTGETPPTLQASDVIRAGGTVIPAGWLEPPQLPKQPGADSGEHDQDHPPQTGEPHGSEAQVVSHDLDDNPEFGILNQRHDFFPVHENELGSPLAIEILRDFEAQRYAIVVEKGITQYLKLTKIDPKETPFILYLIAEAHWHLKRDEWDAPLIDMMNFYTQAVRGDGRGEMGAFGHWRLAQMASQLKDRTSTLEHLRLAQRTDHPQQRLRVRVMQVKTLAELGREGEALALLDEINDESLDDDRRIEFHLLEGALQLQRKDPQGAWEAYEKAAAIDPEWIDLHLDHAYDLARAALGTGHLEKARETIYLILGNFANRPDEQKIRLTLLLAEVWEQTDHEKDAEDAYRELLTHLGDTPKGEVLEQLLLDFHAEELLEREERYCLLLWRQGKIREAMAELNRIYHRCLREGIPTEPLNECAMKIVPSFMEYSVIEGDHFDAAQAWRLYSHEIEDEALRERCMVPLAEALENLGLYKEAVELVDWLEGRPGFRAGTARVELLFHKAKMLSNLGEANEAIATLEQILPDLKDSAWSMEVYRTLAENYMHEQRPLEAAQAYQALGEEYASDPTIVGKAFLRAGELFLEAGMDLQAVELGLKAMLYEKHIHEQPETTGWGHSTADALRLMLARAYRSRDDDERAILVLEDFMRRDGISDHDRAEARLMLADSLRRNGRFQEALDTYRAATEDETTPDLWLRTARRAGEALQWDLDHPNWAIDRPVDIAKGG